MKQTLNECSTAVTFEPLEGDFFVRVDDPNNLYLKGEYCCKDCYINLETGAVILADSRDLVFRDTDYNFDAYLSKEV